MADRPLSGKRVVVTRPAAQAGGLVDDLEALGADVVAIPAFRLRAAAASPLATMLREAGAVHYDTVVFTSANAVRFFLEFAREAGLDATALEGVRIAAVGPSTAGALADHGVAVNCTADPHTAEGMVATLERETDDLSGHRILYPRAADARDVIENALAAAGATVDAVITYGVVPEQFDAPDEIRSALEPTPDVVTFASPSAVLHMEGTLASAGATEAIPRLKRAVTACIGPVTANVARAQGYSVEIEATPHTARGLVDSIVAHYQRSR